MNFPVGDNLKMTCIKVIQKISSFSLTKWLNVPPFSSFLASFFPLVIFGLSYFFGIL